MMRGFIIFAVLLSAAAGVQLPSLVEKESLTNAYVPPNEDVLTTAFTTAATPGGESSSTILTTIALNVDSTTSKPSTSTKEPALEEIAAELPGPVAASPPSSIVDEFEGSKRRVITYDQRQEGQYNIRADLENFMIVLIPPSPAEGLNLLDMLTKSSSLRRNSHTSKGKKKHYSSVGAPQSVKYRQATKSGGSNQNFNYIARPLSSGGGVSSLSPKHGPVAIVEGATSAHRLPEFIEGRTPYHVDISASDDEQSRLHPDRQVDVLPPPYLLGYPHLIKPFHLEAEPTVIQALPPPELHAAHASGNFLESYNQLLTSGLQSAAAESSSRARHNDDGREIGYYRLSRAIRGDNALDSERLANSNSLGNAYTTPMRRYTDLPFYRGDHSFGAANLYPPIDVPKISGYLSLNTGDTRRTLELQDAADTREQNLDDDAHIGEIFVPPLSGTIPQDNVELDLLNVRFINDETKALLSDGMARCAPGRRRDSCGLCREIEGY